LVIHFGEAIKNYLLINCKAALLGELINLWIISIDSFLLIRLPLLYKKVSRGVNEYQNV